MIQETGPAPGRRGGAVVLGVAAVVLAALGAGIFLFPTGEDLPDGVFFRDDFSEIAENWSLDSYKGITTEITDGGYRVVLSKGGSSAHESVSFDGGTEHESVAVSADVRVQSGLDAASVGLTCGYAPGDGESITGLFGRYQAEIGTDGRSRIVRILNADEEVLEQRPAPAVLDEDGPNEIEMTCSYQGETATVTMDVNGKRAIDARDAAPFKSFESAGMYASTSAGGLDVVFDYLEASEVD